MAVIEWGKRRGVPVVLLAFLGVALWSALGASTATAAPCRGAGAVPNTIPTGQAERAVICIVNRVRARRGLRVLRLNKKLRRAARSHSRAIAANGPPLMHRYPGEPTFQQRVRPYLRGCNGGGAVENVAWRDDRKGRPRAVVKQWMNSKLHRRNILNKRLRQIGIGALWGPPSTARGRVGGIYTLVGGFCRRS